MSDIEVKIIADSITEVGNRLTTFEVKYPFIIHGEVMTHRQFSRNYSSNRAIPTDKILNEEIYYPKDVRSNQKGMQGYKNIDESALINFHSSIRTMYEAVSTQVDKFNKKIHKQHVNRYLSPFGYMYGVISATTFENFFNLRISDKAQPEIQVLAEMMKLEYIKSQPKAKHIGDWHLPYLLTEENNLPIEQKVLISSARCARVSYMKHGTNNLDIEEDINLGNNLIKDKHLSAVEHCAMISPYNLMYSNFKQWIQFRLFIERNLKLNDYEKIIKAYINSNEY